jgi:hypothetical protein
MSVESPPDGLGKAGAAAGVPMRTLQEWMGHRDMQTTLIYADYVPNAGEVAMVDRAFADPVDARGHIRGHILSAPERSSGHPSPRSTADIALT